MTNDYGFTLIEMIIVMSVFTVIIAISGKAFETVLKQTGIIAKSEETNIEGAIGLEMLRHDLEQTGFGLYTNVDSTPPTFSEAVSTPASNYNDVWGGGVPRAILAGNNLTSTVLTGTDYLVIKATTVSRDKVSQKWTYIDGAAPGASRVWGTNDFTTNDYVIVVRQRYRSGVLERKLIYNPAVPSSYTVTYKAAASSYADPFGPPSNDVQYFYYGIDGNIPKTPFNRTDYQVKRITGDVTNACSPAAGVLYKSTMINSGTNGGRFVDIPILDCVADMQVVFGWNTSGTTNAVDYFTNADGTATSGSATPAYPVDMTDPAYIRQHLKQIKVYILAQDGRYDKNFSNTKTDMTVGNAISAGDTTSEAALTKTIDLTAANYKNYRWKLYRIIVNPKNLI
jgi:prepilin-type N-terminal cleavage/methylation domain-containing protein